MVARAENDEKRTSDRSPRLSLSPVSPNARRGVVMAAPLRSKAASDRLAGTLEELGASGDVVAAAKQG